MGIRYNPALDGLRAIAVLAVVAYHAGLPVPAGFVGVDVFFVISGYLITRLLRDELAATGRIDFIAFYARRARRLLPALVLVMLVTLALSLALPDAGAVARSAAAASAFVANIYFQQQTSDYWATASEQMPLLHLWSLSVEEQFYLLWPVVLILARRKPAAALLTLALASLALAEWWMARDASMAFYQMPARAWELAAGGLVALCPMRMPASSAPAALVAVLVACFLPFGHFPGVGSLLAVGGSAALIAAIQSGHSPRLMESRPLVYIGLISYSLYLWHWPLLALARAIQIGEPSLGMRLGLVALAVVLAAATHRYIETPFRKACGHRWVVSAGVLSMLGLSAGALAIAPPLPPPTLYTCTRGTVMLPSCVAKAHKVVVWGDSFAQSWEPLALAIAGDRPVVTWHRDFCPPFAGITVERRSSADTNACRANNAAALRYLQANGADVLFLALRFPDYTETQLREGLGNIRRSYHGRVVIVGPTPEVAADVPRCIAAGQDCAISHARYAQQAATAWRVLHGMGFDVIDAGSWLCDADGKCRGVRNGKALYVDNRHVTHETARDFARSLSPTH